jgi:hypothetical protein
LSLTQVRLVGSVDAKRSVGLPNAGEPDSITAFSRISDLGFRTMVRPSDEVDPWNRGRCARGARPVGIPSAAPMTSTGRRFVNATPTMLTAKDDELLGVANRSDAMGLLAVWAVRGRDLVPHLTEQTTSVRGFQILVEAFRLWEHYEPAHPQHAGRLVDFFLLVEQAFARTVGWRDQEWGLPGARRVRARSTEAPHISLVDTEWHLLGSQRATGLWGLYPRCVAASWAAPRRYDSAQRRDDGRGHCACGDRADRPGAPVRALGPRDGGTDCPAAT